MTEIRSKSVDQLVDELIATGTMTSDTLADLEGYRAMAIAGTLEPDDLAYLQALHARITGAPLLDVLPVGVSPDPLDVALARAAAAEAEVERLKALLLAHGLTY